MAKDPTLEEKIHEIDLRDVERLQKLFSRLQSELGGYQKTLQMISLAEAQLDHYRTGLIQEEGIDETTISSGIEHLKDNHVRQLKAMKAAIFSCSNDLKQLHERRNILIAQSRDIRELEED